MNNTKTKRETDLDAITSHMRTAMSACRSTNGRVIIGGDVRIYINMGVGNNYFVADRMSDGIMRYANFHNGIKQASFTPPVECFQREWDEFLSESIKVAKRLGLPITVCEEP